MIPTLDFETYFDRKGFTLSKMTTEAYVRDARFEVHGAAIKWGADGATKWYPHAQLVDLLPILFARADVEAVLCHHAHFDGLILNHVYGCRPKFWYDTLSMARMLIGNHVSVSLDSLSKHFQLDAKNVPYDLFDGKHWHEIPRQHQTLIEEGACHDVDLTWDIFCRLAASFPAEEFSLVDATVRMFTEPCLVGNTGLLGQIWQQEAVDKSALLARLGVTGKELRSNEVFAGLLRTEGVEPAMKPGKPDKEGNDRWIYAFAQTDDFMRDCLDSEDDTVRLLAEARLSEKSNGLQTRTERLGYMSTRGAMCVYLNYCGAHTTRWSGGDKTNWQNFKRGGPLGQAIEAPARHLLVVNDASQIECRILNEVAGQEDKVQEFRDGKDPYTGVASEFYGFEVNKVDHPDERQGGKVVELQSGFGSGGPKIASTLRKLGIPCTDEEGEGWKHAYRSTHPFVVNLWAEAGDVLKKLNGGLHFDWGPLTVKDKRIYLPNGSPLIYETLEWHQTEDGDKFWRVRTRKHGWSKLYGAKLVENVIQALARLHVSQAWVRCTQAGIRMVSMEHDKLIACAAEHEAEAAFAYMKEQMCVPPVWLPRLPLDSEGYISRTFAKEKT